MDDEMPVVSVPGINLPYSEREKARNEINSFSVPIIVNNKPIGSGTLVQIDDAWGILTAEHVVNPGNSKDRLLDATRGIVLGTVTGKRPHALEVAAEYLRIFSTTRLTDAHGPDLAFIELPTGDFLSTLKARMSFFNLTAKTEQRIERGLKEIGLIAVSGWIARMHPAPKRVEPFQIAQGLAGFSIESRIAKHEVIDGWDYLEHPLQNLDVPTLNDGDYGGLSGGGAWRVQVKLNSKTGLAAIHGFSTLAGVVFYEEESDSGNWFVRSHGPLSIYQKFVAYVRSQRSKF